ncbi:MAG: hypothetical protein ACPG5U_01320 [Planktomarina sp.]
MLKRLTLLGAILAGVAPATAQPIIDYDRFPTPYISAPISDPKTGDTYQLSAIALNGSVEAVMLQDVHDGVAGFVEGTYLIPLNLSDASTLETRINGSVAISWGCFACGRSHSRTTATVAFRDGTLKVVGYDHVYVDRMVPAVISCSVNLLNGRFVIEADDKDRQTGNGTDRAYPMQSLTYDAGFKAPQACDRMQKYDEDWLDQNYPDR